MTARPPTAQITAADIRWELAGPPDTPDADTLVIDLVLEAQSYRVLAQVAIRALHDQMEQHEQLRERHHRLIDECRRFRARVMHETGAVL